MQPLKNRLKLYEAVKKYIFCGDSKVIRCECYVCKKDTSGSRYNNLKNVFDSWENQNKQLLLDKAQYFEGTKNRIAELFTLEEIVELYLTIFDAEDDSRHAMVNAFKNINPCERNLEELCCELLNRLDLSDNYMAVSSRCASVLPYAVMSHPRLVYVIQHVIMTLICNDLFKISELSTAIVKTIILNSLDYGICLPKYKTCLYATMEDLSKWIIDNLVYNLDKEYLIDKFYHYDATYEYDITQFSNAFQYHLMKHSNNMQKELKSIIATGSYIMLDTGALTRRFFKQVVKFCELISTHREKNMPKWSTLYDKEIILGDHSSGIIFEGSIVNKIATQFLFRLRTLIYDEDSILQLHEHGFKYKGKIYDKLSDIVAIEKRPEQIAYLINIMLDKWVYYKTLVNNDSACYLPSDARGEYKIDVKVTTRTLLLAGYNVLKSNSGSYVIIRQNNLSSMPECRIATREEGNMWHISGPTQYIEQPIMYSPDDQFAGSKLLHSIKELINETIATV